MDMLQGFTRLESSIILSVSGMTRNGAQLPKKDLIESVAKQEGVARIDVERSIDSLASRTTLVVIEEFIPRHWGHRSKTVVLSAHFQEALPNIRRIPSNVLSKTEEREPPALRKEEPVERKRRARSTR